jgi:hypothetical protein
MIISPYKDQVKLVNKVFNEHKVGYRDNLTVDASHGQEAKLVIFLMTKPSDDGGQRPGFLVDRRQTYERCSESRPEGPSDHREPPNLEPSFHSTIGRAKQKFVSS